MNVIGIDVSMDTLDLFLDKNSKLSDYTKVSNDVSGCLKIHEWIKQHKIRKAVIIMEATGVYYKTVADYFANMYSVYVVNPLKIHEYAKSHFTRTKTDKADARLIADYGKRHFDKLHSYAKTDEKNAELQNLNALYRQLKTQITQNKNRLHIASDVYIKAVLSDLIDKLEEKADETMQRIEKLLAQSPHKQHYENLKTITGIRNKTAAVILHYLLKYDFANVNKFMAFAGLNPQIGQSGTSVNHKEKMTRYGHRKLKSAFYMPALAAYRSQTFEPFVQRLLKQGKPKKLIIGALMRKLAKIAYCVYKSNKPFNPAEYTKVKYYDNQ